MQPLDRHRAPSADARASTAIVHERFHGTVEEWACGLRAEFPATSITGMAPSHKCGMTLVERSTGVDGMLVRFLGLLCPLLLAGCQQQIPQKSDVRPDAVYQPAANTAAWLTIGPTKFHVTFPQGGSDVLPAPTPIVNVPCTTGGHAILIEEIAFINPLETGEGSFHCGIFDFFVTQKKGEGYFVGAIARGRYFRDVASPETRDEITYYTYAVSNEKGMQTLNIVRDYLGRTYGLKLASDKEIFSR